jgi:hypothetical protein
MRGILIAGLLAVAGPASADQLTVDIYQQYLFNYADYGTVPKNDCDNYLRDALERANIQKPFCTIDSVARYLNKGWKVQHSETIHYTVAPPQIHRWECRLFSIECVGMRYYLTSD